MSTPADPGQQWADDRVQRWLARTDALDRQMAPISELLFHGAALQPGPTGWSSAARWSASRRGGAEASAVAPGA